MSMTANNCPCCGGSLLRHVRHGELYWFCQTCRQEVPVLTAIGVSSMEGRTTEVIAEQTVTSQVARTYD